MREDYISILMQWALVVPHYSVTHRRSIEIKSREHFEEGLPKYGRKPAQLRNDDEIS